MTVVVAVITIVNSCLRYGPETEHDTNEYDKSLFHIVVRNVESIRMVAYVSILLIHHHH